jgi:stearoyl-CoA desaturase (delta-9 desaturase)
VGWIFFKPAYERLDFVERDDLLCDPGMESANMMLYIYQRAYSGQVSAQILWSAILVINFAKYTPHHILVPLALLFGFLIPSALGLLWGDVYGAFIWGGLVSKLASACILFLCAPLFSPLRKVWHCTFLVNSWVIFCVFFTRPMMAKHRMAHWNGLQPYSDEDTSRGNLVWSDIHLFLNSG